MGEMVHGHHAPNPTTAAAAAAAGATCGTLLHDDHHSREGDGRGDAISSCSSGSTGVYARVTEAACARGAGEGRDTETEEGRALSILNCSHVFHESCIRAFEQFNIYEVQLCPVCRASYERAPF
jgi:hypothetical protein